MRLAAMLPPPMNPMSDSLIPATLGPIRIMPAIAGHRGIAAIRAGAGRLRQDMVPDIDL